MGIFVGLVSAIAIQVQVSNLGQYLRVRRRLPGAAVPAWWNLFLVLLLVEMWVATLNSFSGDEGAITADSVLVFVLLPIAVTLMAYLLQPPWSQESPGGAEPADLASVLADQRGYFFGLLLALPVLSIGRQLLEGGVAANGDLVFRLLVAAGAVVGMVSRSRRVDLVLAIVMCGLIVAYTLVVFPTVGITL